MIAAQRMPLWMLVGSTLLQANRTGGIALAIAITASLTVSTLNDWALVVYLVAMTVALVVGGVTVGPKRAALPFAAIVMVAWATVPLVPSPANYATAFIGPAAAITYLVRRDIAISALRWLVPTYIAHAGLIYVQAWQTVGRADGLTNNPNPAGGLLAVGTVYALTSPRLRPLAPFLFAAILFTESRWAIIVTSVAVLALVTSGQGGGRWAAGVLAVVTVIVLIGIAGERDGVEVWVRDAIFRLSLADNPHFLPAGVIEETGTHNALTRVAVEGGILVGAMWAGLLALALWRGALSPWWWLIAVMAGLAVMDFYIWRPMQLAPLYWLLIGLNVKTSAENE